MWVGVLGPLCVRDGDSELAVPAAKQRVLLAALLVHANHVVSFGELAEVVWDGAPSAGANVTLRNYVRRLRQALGPVAGARIRTRDPGYLFEAADGELDLLRFAVLCREGGGAVRAGEWLRASRVLDEALELWRGAALADVPSQRLHRDEVPPLAQARLQALEWRMEAGLGLGEHAGLIGGLERLAAEHPLRERFHAQLMLALYRSGRQADALAVYAKARQGLVRELGVEPGPELCQLHERMLRADPELIAGAAARGTAVVTGAAGLAEPGAGGAAAVPRQLPAGIAQFAGRIAELKELAQLLGALEADSGAQVITVVGGMAGVGKTALAVHWAHQVADRFPDGQLYVNLRGFDPAGPPLAPAAAVRGFLHALGVPAHRVPADPDEQAALYRSRLAGKRMLVLVDNARDERHARPLLPGGPGCLVVVTSRNPLTGLVASHAARFLALDLFGDDEAYDLLARRLGAQRLADDPAAVAELIRCCAGLPLALTIAAARAVTGPRLTPARLAAELRDTSARLDALGLADPAMSVRPVIACSYQALSDEAARLFRLLSVSPHPDVPVAAAASILGRGQRQTRALLRELTDAALLQEPVPGRFTSHDLLRAYALELAAEHDAGTGRRAALHRVLDYYLHTAHGACLRMNPNRSPLTLAPPRLGAQCQAFDDAGQAASWLETEEPALLAAIGTVAGAGFEAHCWQLAWTLAEVLPRRARWREWRTAQRTAVAAARRCGDRAGEAISLRFLAQATAQLGGYAEASEHLERALGLFAELGNHVSSAWIHLDLCRMSWLQGRPAEGLGHAEQGLAAARAAESKRVQAAALNAMGWCHTLIGDPVPARARCEEALALYRDNSYGEAMTLDTLGHAHYLAADYTEAIGCYRQALDWYARLGDRWDRASTLSRLGDALHAAGDPAAAETWHEALALMAELEHPDADELRARLRGLRGH